MTNSDTLPVSEQTLLESKFYSRSFLFVVGLGSGFIGGLLEIGGIIVVPVLFLLFSQSGQYPENLCSWSPSRPACLHRIHIGVRGYAQIKGRRCFGM